MTTLADAPSSLLDPYGTLQPFGRYRGAVADTGTGTWDRPSFGARRRLQRKSWIYAGVFHPDFMLGWAIADVGYLGTAFLYVYDRARRVMAEEKVELPFGFEQHFVPSLHAHWSLGIGRRRWIAAPDGDGLRLAAEGERVSCELAFPSLAGGMSALAPSRHRPFNYTYKRLCAEVKVRARLDDRTFEHTLPAGGAIDFTLGSPPRNTRWNWACLQGTTEDGTAFGINLVAHFNDQLENVMWIGDEMVPLGSSEFTFEPPAEARPWRVRVPGDGVDLAFTPEGARRDRKNFGVLAHDFVQPFGRFEGTVTHRGRALRVEGFGVVEDHVSRW